MKQASILGATNSNYGYSERPNYLSPVIQSFATSVLSHSSATTKRGDSSMSFDLDQISNFYLI